MSQNSIPPCDRPTRADSSNAARPRPPLLRALGRSDPPLEIQVDGDRYRRIEILKHDSWAATAIYASQDERIVCKFNRQQPIFGLPARWIGRCLARRETRFLQALEEVPNVPACRGPVCSEGRTLRHCSAHAFVAGHPLRHQEYVDDDFFPALRRTLAALHSRGIAYVDLHKRENIIVDEEGQPHLIDFQVCFMRSRWAWLAWLLKGVEARLMDMDRYHLSKHVFFHRPDLAGAPRRPWVIRAHRFVAEPLRAWRRRLLVAIGVRKSYGFASSERFPEHAVRAEQSHQQQKVPWPAGTDVGHPRPGGEQAA